MAGGKKAIVLTAAACRVPLRSCMFEIGTNCGYSTIGMAMACPGVGIITLEVDPAHMVIAINMLTIAGLAHMIVVWTSHSRGLFQQFLVVLSHPVPSRPVPFRSGSVRFGSVQLG